MASPTPDPDDGSAAPDVSSAPRRERRALTWGIGISIALHAVLLALYPILMERLPSHADPVPDDEPELVERGMEVIALQELLDAPEPEEEPEELPDDPVLPTPVAPPPDDPAEDPVDDPVAEDPVEVEPEEDERRHIAERLQPQTPDARLWAPLDADYMDLTEEEKAQLLLYGMMQDWNDSVAVAAAMAERARDWTVTDSEGRRWGISSGQLHLGDYSVPLPFSFDVPVAPGSTAAHRQWVYEDLMRGATTQAIRETWAERAQEIRRRMDEERDRQRGSGGG